MTQHRSQNRASRHLVDLDARYRERLHRGHTLAPVETVPADGTLLDVVPLPDTGKVLMIVAHVVPASAAPPGSPPEVPADRLPEPQATVDAQPTADAPVEGVTPYEASVPGEGPTEARPRTDDAPTSGEGHVAPGVPVSPSASAGTDETRRDTAPLVVAGRRLAPASPLPTSTASEEDATGEDPARQGDAPPQALRIDQPSRRVWVEGREIGLTYQEFELLVHFTTHPWQVFSRAELMQALWPAVDAATRTVDVHVHRLRRKLGSAGSQLSTVRRVGYTYRPHLANRSGLAPAGE